MLPFHSFRLLKIEQKAEPGDVKSIQTISMKESSENGILNSSSCSNSNKSATSSRKQYEQGYDARKDPTNGTILAQNGSHMGQNGSTFVANRTYSSTTNSDRITLHEEQQRPKKNKKSKLCLLL